jgi:carboxylesterase
MIKGILFFFFCLGLTGCKTRVSYEDNWMDSPNTQDLSLRDPSYKPVSKRLVSSLNNPVLIAVHGESYDVFKKSTWRDWQKPVLDEFEALADGQFSEAINDIFFVDTIILPRDKKLYLMPYLALVLKNVTAVFESRLSRENFYNVLPTSTLSSLAKVIKRTKKTLKKGVKLTQNQTVTIFQATSDTVVNPASADLIYDGFSKHSENVTLHKVDSDFHVFTHLLSRLPKNVSETSKRNQNLVFDYILDKLTDD